MKKEGKKKPMPAGDRDRMESRATIRGKDPIPAATTRISFWGQLEEILGKYGRLSRAGVEKERNMSNRSTDKTPRYRDLVLDARILIDMVFRREEDEDLQSMADRISSGEIRGWVAAQSLPAIVAAINRELKRAGASRSEITAIRKSLLLWIERNFRILSLPGEESRKWIGKANNIAEIQVSLAAGALGGGAALVAKKKDFETGGLTNLITPGELWSKKNEKPKWNFIDLHAQQKNILPSLEERMRTVLRHGNFILGPEIKELEEQLAVYAGVKHVISCASGTDALLLALMAYDIGPGDAIFTSPFTFIATAEVISLLRAIPIFVDIDPQTFNLDPRQLEKAIQALQSGERGIYPLPSAVDGGMTGAFPRPPRARGVMPVDLFGLPAEYDAIQKIAREYGLFVLEDAAQSFGAVYHERRAGSLGDIGAVSFFPAKPLGCYGDGGAVLTDDEELAVKVVSLRVHGKGDDKYDNIRIGINGRLDTLQAAVLLTKLEVLDWELESRQRNAKRYERLLRPLAPALRSPRVAAGMRSAWAQYSLLSLYREEIQSALQREKIPTAVYYPKPLHLQTAYANLGYRSGDFPVSEEVAKRIFSVPMHPYLEEWQIEEISGIIRETVGTLVKIRN